MRKRKRCSRELTSVCTSNLVERLLIWISQAILASVESRETVLVSAPGTEGSHSLPQRPNFSPNTISDSDFMRGGPRQGFGVESSRDTFSDSASIASSRPSHRGGPRNENWYLDYYDPSFNENPWAMLEKEKGLKSLGKWDNVKGGGKIT